MMQWIDVSNEVLGKLMYLMNILIVPEGAQCYCCFQPAWTIQQTLSADHTGPRFRYVCKDCHEAHK